MKSKKLLKRNLTGFFVGFLATLSVAHHGYADAPPLHYMASNGTVLDTETNLLWQQSHQGDSLDWNGAQTYCAGLGLNGLTGWRLPTVKELQTLVDESKINPAIDPVFTEIKATPSEFFWTSMPVANELALAWVVDFYDGSVSKDNPSVPYRVRCVRNP